VRSRFPRRTCSPGRDSSHGSDFLVARHTQRTWPRLHDGQRTQCPPTPSATLTIRGQPAVLGPARPRGLSSAGAAGEGRSESAARCRRGVPCLACVLPPVLGVDIPVGRDCAAVHSGRGRSSTGHTAAVLARTGRFSGLANARTAGARRAGAVAALRGEGINRTHGPGAMGSFTKEVDFRQPSPPITLTASAEIATPAHRPTPKARRGLRSTTGTPAGVRGRGLSSSARVRRGQFRLKLDPFVHLDQWVRGYQREGRGATGLEPTAGRGTSPT